MPGGRMSRLQATVSPSGSTPAARPLRSIAFDRHGSSDGGDSAQAPRCRMFGAGALQSPLQRTDGRLDPAGIARLTAAYCTPGGIFGSRPKSCTPQGQVAAYSEPCATVTADARLRAQAGIRSGPGGCLLRRLAGTVALPRIRTLGRFRRGSLVPTGASLPREIGSKGVQLRQFLPQCRDLLKERPVRTHARLDEQRGRLGSAASHAAMHKHVDREQRFTGHAH